MAKTLHSANADFWPRQHTDGILSLQRPKVHRLHQLHIGPPRRPVRECHPAYHLVGYVVEGENFVNVFDIRDELLGSKNAPLGDSAGQLATAGCSGTDLYDL